MPEQVTVARTAALIGFLAIFSQIAQIDYGSDFNIGSPVSLLFIALVCLVVLLILERRRADEERRQAVEERRQAVEEHQRHLFVNGQGLPSINRNLGSSKESSTPGPSRDQNDQKLLPRIQKLSPNVKQFGIFPKEIAVPQLANPIKLSRSGIRTMTDKGLKWNGEASIVNFVRSVLIDAIEASTLPYDILIEQSLISLRPDLWVVTSNNSPLCVIEVKIPSKKSLGDERYFLERASTNVYHQITCSMMMLRQTFGLKNVFGIVTTYEEWRICWLSDDSTDAIAIANTPQSCAQKIHPTCSLSAARAPATADVPTATTTAITGTSTTTATTTTSATTTTQSDETITATAAAAASATAAPDQSLGAMPRRSPRIAGKKVTSSHTVSFSAASPNASDAPAVAAASASAVPSEAAPAALSVSLATGLEYIVPQLMTPTSQSSASSRPDSPIPESPSGQGSTPVKLGLSKVFQHSDPELPLALVTLMHKLQYVEINNPNESRAYVSYGNTYIEWSLLPSGHSRELRIDDMRKLSRMDSILYLLFRVGRGADGQALLFRDKGGYLYIGKFSGEKLVEDAMTSLNAELNLWRKVHPELEDLVTIRNFGGRAPALIMPRFAHVQHDQHCAPNVVDAVKREIENFAKRGLQHNDLHWRHVGLYTVESTLHAVFFDLGRVLSNVLEKDAFKHMSEALFEGCQDSACQGAT